MMQHPVIVPSKFHRSLRELGNKPTGRNNRMLLVWNIIQANRGSTWRAAAKELRYCWSKYEDHTPHVVFQCLKAWVDTLEMKIQHIEDCDLELAGSPYFAELQALYLSLNLLEDQDWIDISHFLTDEQKAAINGD